jgi:HAMP domain-containing protein
MQLPKLFITLRLKLMLIFVLIAITPIVVVSYLSYTKSHASLQQNLYNSLAGILENKKKGIAEYFTSKVEAVENAAKTPYLVTHIMSISGMNARHTAEESVMLRDNLAGLFGKGEFDEVFVVDPTGNVLASTVPKNEGRDIKRLSYVIRGAEKTYVQSVFPSPINDTLNMVIAVPIKSAAGESLGILAARLNLEKIYQIVAEIKGLGETGETLIADLRGNEAVVLGPTRFNKKAALELKIPIGGTTSKALQHAVQGESGRGLVTDYRDIEVAAVWTHVTNVGWGLIIKVDTAEILAPLKDLRDYIFLLGGMLILVVLLISYIVSMGIVKPIKDLTDAADRISKGDLTVQVTIHSRDEIGKLAQSFERMVAAIKYLKAKEEEMT